MTSEKINSEADYDQTLEWIDWQFDKNIDPNSADGSEIQQAILRIKQYEYLHYPMLISTSKEKDTLSKGFV